LAHWPRVIPDILLVPLLAFDDHGYRLGYGGGYYDRTLAAIRRARAIGIAYAGQRMDFLPHDAHDYPLNAILTETGLTEFPR
jgi:5-formyltetrahydrofolate cyclo-ligase